MKSFCTFFVALLIAISTAVPGVAQTDEIRQATGLPIPIGAQVIYGRVNIKGVPSGERKPLVFVTLIQGGIQAGRAQTNDDGYYYFLKAPVNGSSLIFEADNIEIGRVVLSGEHESSVRQDINLDWRQLKQVAQTTGVVSAKSAYDRSAEANATFDKAMQAAKDKKTDVAISLFKQIVEKDPKDFPAWTELGTLYFSSSSYSEGEAAYTKAIEAKPDYMVAIMNLGKLHFSQKQYEKAIQTFMKAVTVKPDYADAFVYIGDSYIQLKVGSKAVVAYNEALRLAPEKIEIHLRLATLYNAAGAKDRAANEYAQLLKKKPDYADKEKLEKYIKENTKP